jgi:hypothetical protein
MRPTVLIEITPSVVSSRPLRGLFSSAKGVLKGALTGTVSGLLGGEWGSGSSVLKIVNVRIEDEMGKNVLWLEEVLEVLELEHDLDAIRRLGGKAKDGVMGVAAALLAAGGPGRCVVM